MIRFTLCSKLDAETFLNCTNDNKLRKASHVLLWQGMILHSRQ